MYANQTQSIEARHDSRMTASTMVCLIWEYVTQCHVLGTAVSVFATAPSASGGWPLRGGRVVARV
ncbi:hypothetical protein BW247_08320 [Acidihalobacter ferrooxydans]|uniref:Uncharacterized protein n=1 Tax=Acidihalobacter ferrooxydans TaxID=1765967 RepID=A0A1P8UGX1_9GAMM|nr:hypothetical protein BW247_08320 [Acidihalobacter ferrooxydans]